MNFEFPEDQDFFERLLIGDDIHLSIQDFNMLFDFRYPKIKRREFNRIRNSVFSALAQKYGLVCQLKMDCCDPESGFAVDHLIPLSTNKLNKELRSITPPKGRKVPTQSFGSNHIDNLIIACTKCNNRKKHRILDSRKLQLILAMKKA